MSPLMKSSEKIKTVFLVLSELFVNCYLDLIAQNLQVYSDAIYYKQFLSSEDYTNSIFDFLSAAEKLRNHELVQLFIKKKFLIIFQRYQYWKILYHM